MTSELLLGVAGPSSAAIPDEFQNTLDAGIQSLILLSDVMNLCFQPAEEDPGAPRALSSGLLSESLVGKWEALLNRLLEWHAQRPTEHQAVMEVEHRDTSFPFILFTSNAGVAANTVHHTAMLLLLTHKPRTVTLAGRPTTAGAAQLSPLWQARRVCGIALSSDPEHTRCWDPCMIAAFSLAARRMTHPAQQTELLACLERLGSVGWRIDGLARSWREEWGIGW